MDALTTAKIDSTYSIEELTQADYFLKNGSYEQKWPKEVNGIIYETHVYDGPQGKGFVLLSKDSFRNCKAIGFGSEDRDREWTAIGVG